MHKAKHFYEVEGLEVNPHTAAIAEQHFKVHKHFLGELDLKPEYDIVTLHQILYGIPDPVGLLCDIHGVLKEDGLLYINTPNANSYSMALYRGKANHLYGYTTLNVSTSNLSPHWRNGRIPSPVIQDGMAGHLPDGYR